MSQNAFPLKGKLQDQKLKQMQQVSPYSTHKKKINNNKISQIQEVSQQNDIEDVEGTNCDSCFEPTQVRYFLYSWVLFLISFAVYILIWIIGHFSIQRLTSYYYFNAFNISPDVHIDFWKISTKNTDSSPEVYVSSRTLYTNEQLKKPDAVALSLLFSWLMWKLPLTVFTLKMIRDKSHSRIRYVTYGFYLVLLLLIDIMSTVFQPESYQDWIFFIIYFVLSIFLIGINGFQKRKRLFKNLINYLLPIIYIIFAYVSFIFFVPALYGTIFKGLGQDASFVIVHVFPFIDFILYVLIIVITYFCDPHTMKFIKMLHFLNTGYIIGHILLFSPDQPEFYYLITYFAIRNLSFNWILQRVQKYVINPCPLPGWIMIYLVSLCINFIPFVGLGKLVVSKSFYSQILQITLPILRYAPSNYYPIYNTTSLPQFNNKLISNTQISGVFIIWIILSITQKYHMSKVQFKQIFFYVFGIYLFYFGLTTSIQLYHLQSNSL